MLLVVLEHDRGAVPVAAEEALTAGRDLAVRLGLEVAALAIGAGAEALAEVAGRHGVALVHHAHHPLLTDFGPEAWGETVAQAAVVLGASVVMSVGTDLGNEVMAQAAARMDQPFVANCLSIDPDWKITRVRWGGSLLEEVALEAPIRLVTFAHHAVEPSEAPVTATVDTFEPELAPELGRTIVTDRGAQAAGVTLATAPVVVGGGRGVGSPEGFAVLEELAALLGGRVGCSRVVTNNGWRPHTDQVGQTGTKIAPDLYIACGISGAIQHWVGAAGSKRILAINTDKEANMVAKADYAVIGDLHEVIPAISAEIKRRRG
jgi:electron transfer flavoprotein alpha subunit